MNNIFRTYGNSFIVVGVSASYDGEYKNSFFIKVESEPLLSLTKSFADVGMEDAYEKFLKNYFWKCGIVEISSHCDFLTYEEINDVHFFTQNITEFSKFLIKNYPNLYFNPDKEWDFYFGIPFATVEKEFFKFVFVPDTEYVETHTIKRILTLQVCHNFALELDKRVSNADIIKMFDGKRYYFADSVFVYFHKILTFLKKEFDEFLGVKNG